MLFFPVSILDKGLGVAVLALLFSPAALPWRLTLFYGGSLNELDKKVLEKSPAL